MGRQVRGGNTFNHGLLDKPMKIAITGASGFIGRHVVRALAGNDGIDIIALTRNAGRPAGLKSGVRVVEMDIANPGPDCYDHMGRPDVLVHLAWDGLPNYQSMHHFERELPRQFQFLKALVEEGLPRLLVSGTCLEYGMQSGPLSEELTTMPATPYGFAKDALRRQLEFLKAVKPFALTWARLFYMYGEGQSENSLYAQLEKAVQSKERVFNMSGGEQVRDYLPVSEVARHIVDLAIIADTDVGVVNVCSGRPVSVRRVVEQWIKENGWNIDLNLGYYPYTSYEPMAFWGDRAKLQTVSRTAA